MSKRNMSRLTKQTHIRLFYLSILFLAMLSGCGSDQPSNQATGNSASVQFRITMPKAVAGLPQRNTFFAMVQRWLFPAEAWADGVGDLRRLIVEVKAPDLSPQQIASQTFPTAPTGGQEVKLQANVPIGSDRTFTVIGFNATSQAILRGESARTTVAAGQSATVDIVVVNVTAPTANAGLDQGGKLPGAIVTLNGSGSSDPNGDLLGYRWTFTTRPAGSQASLANANSVSPSFTVDRDGDYVIQLIVNDGTVDSSPDTVTVSSTNVPPVANAGQDQGGKTRGMLITLNGSTSSDANGDPLTYRWSFKTRPGGSQAVLTNPTSVSPTFTIDRDGDYEIQLIVNDGTVDGQSDTVTVSSIDVAPVANAGPDQGGAFPAGTVITLDGSASSDVNGDPLTYRWAFTTRPAGSQAVLSNATSVRPTFTVDRDGNYIAQLTVNDRILDSQPDTVIVSSGEIAPVANAGPDQGGKLPDSVITLNGSASSDPNRDPLTYRWAFTARPVGSQATLVNPTSVSPTFTVDRDGQYVIQLIVNDGTVESPADTVIVTSDNVRPVAHAGPDQSVTFPDCECPLTVTLDGSASSDANHDPLNYQWSVTSSPTCSECSCTPLLQNATSVNPTFDPNCSGDYVFQLIVNDGTVDSLVPDTVTITVLEPLIITTPSKLPAGSHGFSYDPDSSDSLIGYQLQVFGGTGAYTWSTIGGAWPPDITLSPGGVISGRTSCLGFSKTYSMTVQVTDDNGTSAQRVFTLFMSSCID
jgi:PKD domain